MRANLSYISNLACSEPYTSAGDCGLPDFSATPLLPRHLLTLVTHLHFCHLSHPRITFVLNGIKEIAKIHAGKEDKDSLLMDIVDQIDSFLR